MWRHIGVIQPIIVSPLSATTVFSMKPNFSISTRTTSPTFINEGGDVGRVEIEKLGYIENTVVAESGETLIG